MGQYGLRWDNYDPLEIVMYCIRKGGQWTHRGQTVGAPLFDLYREAMRLCWPEEDLHRWVDIILQNILTHKMTVIIGPKSSGKTHTCAKFVLIDYWAYPNDTCVLVSSTELRGAELRIWGDIKSLVQQAKKRYEWIAGEPLESKHAITTDKLSEDCETRDLRKGLICIPCKNSSGKYVGMGAFVGIKNKRMRLLGDEIQFMPPIYLDIPSNLDANPDFKGMLLGNPLDALDGLGRAAEPLDGWNSVGEPKKTCVWHSRFLDGVTVNLVGPDSPNFDPPIPEKPRYPYLIHAGSIRSTVMFYGQDSAQYWSQCVGIMKVGALARRVITRQLCLQFHALDDVTWKGGDPHTKIYSVDVAYGSVGGDRCVAGWIEFGKDKDNKTIIRVYKPSIVPVGIGKQNPEDIIAEYVRRDCERLGIIPENVFYDSTGRGSMGTAFSRVWSDKVNPVEFGGAPTPRPVCTDLYLFDPKERKRRLKRCDEHYSKRVTEFWFSVRYVIESDQLRGLPEEVMQEGCQREWKMVRGDKIEVESKEEMKERAGQSPDLFDWLVTAVEGARQRGFNILKLANQESYLRDQEWIERLKARSHKLHSSHQLVYQD